MKSKTSSFNLTIFKKSITRFWPIWAAYFIFWLIALPISTASDLSHKIRFYDDLSHVLSYSAEQVFTMSKDLGIAVGAITAIFAAIALWGFMYSSKSASGYASLPVSRRSYFVSLTLAGTIPVIVINFVISSILFLVMASYGIGSFAIAMQVFAIITLIYLFFYFFATFCAQLTGTAFVLVPLYALLNFVVIALYVIGSTFLSRLVYGLTATDSALQWLSYLSPPVGMIYGTGMITTAGTNVPMFTGWGCLITYAVVGIIFAVTAYLIFRRRRMEAAGDVVAVNILKPVFKYCMTLGCAIVFCALMIFVLNDTTSSSDLFTIMLLLAIGAIIGYYISEMLIKKSFRVFKKRTAPGILISLAVILLITAAIELDFIGYEKYVPNISDVERVSLNGCEVDEADLIEEVIDVHKAIIADKERNEAANYGDGYFIYYQSIHYYLKNGKTVFRQYRIISYFDDANSPEILTRINEFLNKPEMILSGILPSFEIAGPENVASVSIACEIPSGGTASEYDMPTVDRLFYYSGEDAYELWNDCILPDIEDGCGIGKNTSYYYPLQDFTTTTCVLYFEFVDTEFVNTASSGPPVDRGLQTLCITTDAARTLEWLEAHDIPVYTYEDISAAYEDFEMR